MSTRMPGRILVAPALAIDPRASRRGFLKRAALLSGGARAASGGASAGAGQSNMPPDNTEW